MAVEANKTIIIDEPEVIQFAIDHRIKIIAVDEEEMTAAKNQAA